MLESFCPPELLGEARNEVRTTRTAAVIVLSQDNDKIQFATLNYSNPTTNAFLVSVLRCHTKLLLCNEYCSTELNSRPGKPKKKMPAYLIQPPGSTSSIHRPRQATPTPPIIAIIPLNPLISLLWCLTSLPHPASYCSTEYTKYPTPLHQSPESIP